MPRKFISGWFLKWNGWSPLVVGRELRECSTCLVSRWKGHLASSSLTGRWKGVGWSHRLGGFHFLLAGPETDMVPMGYWSFWFDVPPWNQLPWLAAGQVLKGDLGPRWLRMSLLMVTYLTSTSWINVMSSQETKLGNEYNLSSRPSLDLSTPFLHHFNVPLPSQPPSAHYNWCSLSNPPSSNFVLRKDFISLH